MFEKTRRLCRREGDLTVGAPDSWRGHGALRVPDDEWDVSLVVAFGRGRSGEDRNGAVDGTIEVCSLS